MEPESVPSSASAKRPPPSPPQDEEPPPTKRTTRSMMLNYAPNVKMENIPDGVVKCPICSFVIVVSDKGCNMVTCRNHTPQFVYFCIHCKEVNTNGNEYATCNCPKRNTTQTRSQAQNERNRNAAENPILLLEDEEDTTLANPSEEEDEEDTSSANPSVPQPLDHRHHMPKKKNPAAEKAWNELLNETELKGSIPNHNSFNRHPHQNLIHELIVDDLDKNNIDKIESRFGRFSRVRPSKAHEDLHTKMIQRIHATMNKLNLRYVDIDLTTEDPKWQPIPEERYFNITQLKITNVNFLRGFIGADELKCLVFPEECQQKVGSSMRNLYYKIRCFKDNNRPGSSCICMIDVVQALNDMGITVASEIQDSCLEVHDIFSFCGLTIFDLLVVGGDWPHSILDTFDTRGCLVEDKIDEFKSFVLKTTNAEVAELDEAVPGHDSEFEEQMNGRSLKDYCDYICRESHKHILIETVDQELYKLGERFGESYLKFSFHNFYRSVRTFFCENGPEDLRISPSAAKLMQYFAEAVFFGDFDSQTMRFITGGDGLPQSYGSHWLDTFKAMNNELLNTNVPSADNDDGSNWISDDDSSTHTAENELEINDVEFGGCVLPADELHLCYKKICIAYSRPEPPRKLIRVVEDLHEYLNEHLHAKINRLFDPGSASKLITVRSRFPEGYDLRTIQGPTKYNQLPRNVELILTAMADAEQERCFYLHWKECSCGLSVYAQFCTTCAATIRAWP